MGERGERGVDTDWRFPVRSSNGGVSGRFREECEEREERGERGVGGVRGVRGVGGAWEAPTGVAYVSSRSASVGVNVSCPECPNGEPIEETGLGGADAGAG